MADLMEAVTSLAKRRGIAFQSSEIYGGLRSSWDYGPLGTEIKRNVREQWWRSTVQLRDDVVGLDASVIMSPKVWEASGHLEVFTSDSGPTNSPSRPRARTAVRRPSRNPATST